MKQSFEVETVYYDRERRVITADVRIEVSQSSIACLHVYIGSTGKLYVESTAGHQSIESIIQWAAYLAAHEQWMIETIQSEWKRLGKEVK